MGVEQNQTLFVGNIPMQVKSNDLRSCLFELFCPYGPILEIKMQRREKPTRVGKDKAGKMYEKGMPLLKCIAFIVFKEKGPAVLAKRLNGFNFFGRPLKIDFAKTKSDIVAHLDGTYNAKTVEKAPEQKIVIKKPKKAVPTPAVRDEEMDVDEEVDSGARGFSSAHPETMRDQFGEPSSTLYVQEIGASATGELMTPLFEQYPGFLELRHNAQRQEVIVEFKAEEYATVCLKELHGFRVDLRNELQISYGR